MEIAVDDANHKDWRAEIVGLIDEWRTTGEIDLRDDEDLDLIADERKAMTAP